METGLLKLIQEFLSADGVAAHILAKNSLIHDSAIFQLTQRCKQRLFVLPGDFASNKRLIGILLGNGLLSLKVQKQNKQKYMQTQCKYRRENDLQQKVIQVIISVHPGEEKKNLRTHASPSTPPTPVFADCPSKRERSPGSSPQAHSGESPGGNPLCFRQG